MKNIYLKLEDFYTKKPLQFWFITFIIASLPFISLSQILLVFLNSTFLIKGYAIIIFSFLSPFLLVFVSFYRKAKSNSIIRNLEAIKIKLENPFHKENVRYPGNTKYIETFYHYEILECFEVYNKSVIDLKSKNPKQFGDLKLRDIPKVQKDDWVRESVMNVIKSDVIGLLKRLK